MFVQVLLMDIDIVLIEIHFLLIYTGKEMIHFL